MVSIPKPDWLAAWLAGWQACLLPTLSYWIDVRPNGLEMTYSGAAFLYGFRNPSLIGWLAGLIAGLLAGWLACWRQTLCS
jgi:hypothetical protein